MTVAKKAKAEGGPAKCGELQLAHIFGTRADTAVRILGKLSLEVNNVFLEHSMPATGFASGSVVVLLREADSLLYTDTCAS